nr:hypothetical protein [Anaerolineae bacterium]
ALLSPKSANYLAEDTLAKLDIEYNVPTEILLEWAANNKPKGARILAAIAQSNTSPLPQLARQLIIQYGDDKQVRDWVTRPAAGFTIYGGRYSDQLKRELDIARGWLEDNDPAIQKWAEDKVSGFEERYNKAKQMDDEELI